MSEPYSRLYWKVMSDEKFDGIREDLRLFGAWSLLLVIADMAYPVPAYIPPTVPRASVRRLVEVGLIDEMPGHRYLVHGLEAERVRRSEAGRAGGKASGRSRSADATNPERTFNERSTVVEPDKGRDKDEAKTRQSQDTAQDGARDPADVYWQLVGRWPKDGALSWIDGLTEQYGAEPTIAALAAAHLEDKSSNTLIGRTRDRLAAKARQLDLKERAEEKQRLAEKRAQPRVEEAWRAEFRAAIEEQYRRSAA
jgi:hypothetical protein